LIFNVRPFGISGLAESGRADRIAQCPRALHENIMVAATVAIGAFVFRPRQLIGYDRLRSQRADAPFEIPTEIWKLTQEERHNDR
jgi:hypothetical protein